MEEKEIALRMEEKRSTLCMEEKRNTLCMEDKRSTLCMDEKRSTLCMEEKRDLVVCPPKRGGGRGKRAMTVHCCNLCGKGFSSQSQLNRHCTIHQAVRSPSCSICRKRFDLETQLAEHVLVHKDVKRHKCHICGKKFMLKCHLDGHSVIHTGAKPHKCSTCGKDFSLQSNLAKHMLIHRGIRPHKCTICQKDFTQKAHLEEHTLIHIGIKPHICQICGKSFAKRYHVNRHILIHSRVSETPVGDPLRDEDDSSRCFIESRKRHACKICGKRFKKKYHLNRHSLIHSRASEMSKGDPLSHDDPMPFNCDGLRSFLLSGDVADEGRSEECEASSLCVVIADDTSYLLEERKVCPEIDDGSSEEHENKVSLLRPETKAGAVKEENIYVVKEEHDTEDVDVIKDWKIEF